MFVVVVTARGAAATPHWSVASGELLVRRLAAAGHEVVWFAERQPLQPQLPAPAGVDVRAFVAPAPPFRRVQAHGEHLPLDVELARSLRARPADAVVHVGLGAVGSVQPLWLADRMGSPALAVIAGREALCHRGSLRHADGSECRIVDDARRCWSCIATPAADGLRPLAARAMRLLRRAPLLSPFPGVEQFQNRLDLIVGSLQVARAVLVVDQLPLGLLAGVGVPSRLLEHADPGQAMVERVVRLATSAPAPPVEGK